MFKTPVLLVLGVCLLEFVTPIALPSYIKACKAGPTFNDCIVKTANEVIPILVKGDKKYRAVPLDPLEFEKIAVNEDGKKSISMNVTLSKGKIIGLKDAKVIKADFDLDKKKVFFECKVPKVTILCDYDVAGKFLILPITGNGPATIELDKVSLYFNLDYELAKINGEEHIQLTKSNLNHKLEKLRVDLKNLFNGDKALGDNMNQVLNDNWSELNESLGPSIAKAIGMVVAHIINEIAKSVSYKELIVF